MPASLHHTTTTAHLSATSGKRVLPAIANALCDARPVETSSRDQARSISAAISRAARKGSGAFRIARPTTM